ncbi:hypothetical protein D1872_324180 [compost metagenome]
MLHNNTSVIVECVLIYRAPCIRGLNLYPLIARHEARNISINRQAALTSRQEYHCIGMTDQNRIIQLVLHLKLRLLNADYAHALI